VQVDPSVLGQGAISKVAFTGTDFRDGMTLDPGLGLTATGTSVPSSSQLVAVVTVAPDAAPGHRTPVFTTSDGRKVFCNECLTISPAPLVQRIAPNVAGQGASTRLVVESLYLTDKTQLSLSGTGITLVPKNVFINVQTHQLVAPIAVDSNATPGARDVTLLNPDGGKSTCRACFNVTPAPVVSKANPPQVYWGTNTVQLFGSGFTPNTAVQFPSGTVTVDSVKFVNSGEIDIAITVSQKTPAGYQRLVVTNPDGGRSQCDQCLYVTVIS
jgi:hypothetical protein